MSFDMRQNVLMVRTVISGQPFYSFYTAMGMDFSLSGYQLKEIYDCHYKGQLRGVTVYWGYSNKATTETFDFSSNGDLLWNVSLNQTCSTLLPIEMINGAEEGFNVINGIMIEDHVRQLIKIHQRAVGRAVSPIVFFDNMSEEHMRTMLLALGHGPLRVEEADREALIKLHTNWLRKHDAEFKYTHNRLGLEPDEKLPADLYDDHGLVLTNRHMAAHKSMEIMARELCNLVQAFDLENVKELGPIDKENPDWRDGLRRIAEAYIYDPNAKEAFEEIQQNTQFVINAIYAMAKDLTWQDINADDFEYNQSLLRRLMQELRNAVEQENGAFVLQNNKVCLRTAKAEPESMKLPEERPRPRLRSNAKKVQPKPAGGSERYPAVRREDRICWDAIRALLPREFQQAYSINANTATSGELVEALYIAVFNPRDTWFENLQKADLEKFACCLTVITSAKVEMASEKHLKNVIKRALDMLDADD